MSGESAESSINTRAQEVTTQLEAIAENLDSLIFLSDDSNSMRLSNAAKRIGKIANSADNALSSDYGVD